MLCGTLEGSFVIASFHVGPHPDLRSSTPETGGALTPSLDGKQGLDASFLACHISDALVILDAKGTINYLNMPALRVLAKLKRQKAVSPSPDQWLGQDLWESLPALAESPLFKCVHLVKAGGETAKFATQIQMPPVCLEGSVAVYGDGVALFFRDVSEIQSLRENEQRIKRELKTISACHQILIRSEDEKQLLNEICHVICEQAGHRMAWVGYAQDDDAKSVLPVAWAGFEAGYLSQLNISWADNERGRGPTGSAIRSQANSFCSDFASDPNVAPWREAALRRGYLSSIVLPLKDDGQRTFGALSIYSSQANCFTPDEVHILEQLAADLAFGICVLRGRAARQQSADELRAVKEAAQRELALAQAASEQARQATLEVYDTKNAFLANLTHEIRTPLTAILGYAELIATEAGASSRSADRDRYLEALERNGRLLSNIINDLLDLSKLASGKLELNLQAIPIREVMADMEMLLNPQALAKNLALHIRSEPEVPPVIRTDRMRLLQVLLNIVGNAIKFTDKGSVVIEIKRLTPLRDKRNGLAFVITDTGTGISENDAAKLFQPFTQADSSLRRQFGGQGVGLTLARRICEMLGGSIALTRTEPGRGSTFTITFMNCLIDKPATPPEVDDACLLEELPLGGARILLVDDSPDIQVLVARYLKLAGASVEIAVNGQIAVEMAKRNPYDQILMDIQMPVMDGYAAAVAMRTMGIEIPIVALTAHASKEERKRCIDCGFTEHLAKPINRATLVETLTRLKAPALNDRRP